MRPSDTAKRSMHVRSMPAWMLFGGRIAPGQQIADAQWLPVGRDHGSTKLTLNAADSIFVRNNGWFRSISTLRR